MLPWQPEFQSNAAFFKTLCSFFFYLMMLYMKYDLNWPTDSGELKRGNNHSCVRYPDLIIFLYTLEGY